MPGFDDDGGRVEVAGRDPATLDFAVGNLDIRRLQTDPRSQLLGRGPSRLTPDEQVHPFVRMPARAIGKEFGDL